MDHDMEKFINELIANIEEGPLDLNFLSILHVQSHPIDWDQDKWIEEIAPEIVSLFPRAVDHNHLLTSCSAFWAWYFQQKKSIPTETLRSIMSTILSRLVVNKTPVLSGPNREAWEGIPANTSDIVLTRFCGEYTPSGKTYVGCRDWGRVDAERAVLDLLSMIERSKNETEEGLQHMNLLVRITSFWILALFRLTTKSEKLVIRLFRHELNSTASILMRKKTRIPPPPLNTLLEFKRAFLSGCKPTQAVLTVLTYSYVNHRDKDVITFLEEGCIRTLNYTGLGLITWLEKAANALNVSRSELLSCFATVEKQSYERVLSFDASVAKWGKMFSFSRLFKEEYLKQYSISSSRDNESMSLICAFIVAGKNPRENPMAYPQFSKLYVLERRSKMLAEKISSELTARK